MNEYEGPERRGPNRRGSVNTFGETPSYFEQMILQHLQTLQKHEDHKDVTETTMSMKSLGPLIVTIVTTIVFLVGVWVNLNSSIDHNANVAEKEITELRHSYEMNKVQMEKISSDAEKTIAKLEVKLDMIDKRISELDLSVSQMYQRMSGPKDFK